MLYQYITKEKKSYNFKCLENRAMILQLTIAYNVENI